MYIPKSSRVKKISCVQSLDVIKIRGKDKFYIFTEPDFKKYNGYLKKKKNWGEREGGGQH